MFFDTNFLIFAGICWAVLAFAFGRVVGLIGLFFIAMPMFFKAWLQFINFDGGWPKDQPYIEYYTPTPEEDRRLWARIEPINTMTDRDWKDYHKCKDHNICVRRFAR